MDAVIKVYETKDTRFSEVVYDKNDLKGISEEMLTLTNNLTLSDDVARWCEMAKCGDIYYFDGGEVEIMDIK